MYDIFGRIIKAGDFVAFSRYKSIYYGFVTATFGVKHQSGTMGDPNAIVLMNNCTDLEVVKKRDALAKLFREREENKRLTRQAALKRSEFRVGHVYHKLGDFYSRLYLGKVDLDGQPFENLWVNVSKKNHKEDWDIGNIDFNKDLIIRPAAVKTKYYVNHWRCKDVKRPMVHEDLGVVSTADLFTLMPIDIATMHQNVGDVPL